MTDPCSHVTPKTLIKSKMIFFHARCGSLGSGSYGFDTTSTVVLPNCKSIIPTGENGVPSFREAHECSNEYIGFIDITWRAANIGRFPPSMVSFYLSAQVKRELLLVSGSGNTEHGKMYKIFTKMPAIKNKIDFINKTSYFRIFFCFLSLCINKKRFINYKNLNSSGRVGWEGAGWKSLIW